MFVSLMRRYVLQRKDHATPTWTKQSAVPTSIDHVKVARLDVCLRNNLQGKVQPKGRDEQEAKGSQRLSILQEGGRLLGASGLR
jgi:hypothetical protein